MTINREMHSAIGKTRQSSGSHSGPLRQEIASLRGVLHLPRVTPDVSRWAPPAPLAQYIDYFWAVRWDLTGCAPHVQETAPHPNVYLVFDNDRLEINGVAKKKFVRVLEGRGRAFGVKFLPGGFRPFWKAPIATLTGRILPARNIFGEDANRLEHQLRDANADSELTDATTAFFLERIPADDSAIELATALVERILTTPDIKTVEDLGTQAGMGARSLQRLFREYVGVSPKWVIRRYRLHELISRINSGQHLHWAHLAAELGYFDQAHLIRDFKAIVGHAPAEYQRRQER